MTNTETYWSLLNTFYNGKKVPVMPPLLIDNQIILDFEAKTISIIFCVSQCTSLNNKSKIPENKTYAKNTKLFIIKFENKDIINIIIRVLNIDKAHGHYNISIKT